MLAVRAIDYRGAYYRALQVNIQSMDLVKFYLAFL